VSHQIYINGDQSWVKLEASGQVREEELAEESVKRIQEFVNTELLGVINNTVALVEDNQTE